MAIHKLGTFGRDKRGSTAVEFALVAPLFFTLIFSILEAGWFFFVNSAVEQANATASRLIRTGQAQSSTDADGNPVYSRDAFFDEICRVVDSFGDCEDRLTVDVSRYANFAALSADLSSPVCRDANDTSIEGAQFSQADYGGQNEIIRVRVCFLYKPINPFVGFTLPKDANGFRAMTSLAVFRNEPFES